MGSAKVDWKAVAAARRDRISGKIPVQWLLQPRDFDEPAPIDVPHRCAILNDTDLRITELKAVEIIKAVRDRELTALDVTLAFCKRAAIAHQLTNCLAEVLFEEALARASELDEYVREHGKPVGPLHGLPISVKEHIYVRGTTATSGLVVWADQISPDDALIVKIFREQGAIPFVKTTNPQSLMALETVSNLFGRTLNPHNVQLTSGGSSGGEAALIAMRGSPLGIGTDIGGSIRVPSAFCGTYGLKPSVGRTPHSGLSGLHAGMQNIVGVVGPMAHSIDDLELFLSAAVRNRPWEQEPAVIEKPWMPAGRISERLRIGIILTDGIVHPHPPVTRALKEAVRALQRDGHEIVPWDSHLHKPLYEVTNQAYFLDGGDEYTRRLTEGGEPPVSILEWLMKAHGGVRRSLEKSWQVNIELDELRTLYLKQWNDAQIDCLICPVSPSVASVHDETMYWGYTSVFNALDYPVSCIPVGEVEDSDTWERYPGPSIPSGSADLWYRQLYDDSRGPERYQKAPTSIQIVGRRLQEEKLLEMTRCIAQALRDRPMDMEKSSPLSRDALLELPGCSSLENHLAYMRPLL